MKFPFFKTLVVAGAFALICGCDDNPVSKTPDPAESLIVTEESYVYVDQANNYYVITKAGIVSDTTGVVIGTANIQSGLIIDSNNNIIAENVDFTKLDVVEPTIVVQDGWLLRTGDQNYVILGDGTVTDATGTVIGTFTLNANNEEGSFKGKVTDLSGNTIAKNVDLADLKVVQSNIAVSSSSVVVSSSSETPVSSAVMSSAAVSSSSVAVSSSSVAVSSSSNACPVIKTVSGGASGSGWATRYWDCCKPSCSWAENAGGNLARQCTTSGSIISDASSTSVCDGGSAATCVSQVPFTIDGCDTLGFAFAAVPASNGGQCGHCYELTFTGEGHYSSTNANTQKLKTQKKKLIIMASNVGSDVTQGQFDVMIPGGGYGIFNGCANKMGWGDQGQQYGGLLSDCETSTNYTASKYASCLTTKCNSTFANDATAKAGCLFLANYLNAAGNPEHTYKEVECPTVLKNKY